MRHRRRRRGPRERERGERAEALREAEDEERAGAEAQGPRVTAVAEAGRLARPVFIAKAYVPPTPHLFVPSGFAPYVPQRTEYDAELALRDPATHISTTWAERERFRGIYAASGARATPLPCT